MLILLWNFQIAKLHSEMEQQRLDLERAHSTEMEEMLEKTNARLKEIEKEYAVRSSKAAEVRINFFTLFIYILSSQIFAFLLEANFGFGYCRCLCLCASVCVCPCVNPKLVCAMFAIWQINTKIALEWAHEQSEWVTRVHTLFYFF